MAAQDSSDLVQRLGASFARGHKEASGGIVPVAEFEELMALMRVGEKPDPGTVSGPGPGSGETRKAMSSQKNNLLNYFGKK